MFSCVNGIDWQVGMVLIDRCDMCSLSELFFPIFNTISSSLAPIDVSVSLTMQPFVDLIVALLRDEQMCLLFMQYHQSVF